MRSVVSRIQSPLSRFRGRVAGIVVVLLLVLVYVMSVFCAEPVKRPPDLYRQVSGCTRLEIMFRPTAREFFSLPDDEARLLSPEEWRKLELLEKITCTDAKDIGDFATLDLIEARYVGPSKGGIAMKHSIGVVGYRNQEKVIEFTIYGTTIRTYDGFEFECSHVLRHFHLLARQIQPVTLRLGCADKLEGLYSALSRTRGAGTYPRANEWCDILLREDRTLQQYNQINNASPFECPAARTCHYAINPDCRPDSPTDVVLLFESKPGWNQHGGPESFTFDNHDPKGGLVLLNNGTMKFIRTAEELKQLRWK
jgi:hypothetical protein